MPMRFIFCFIVLAICSSCSQQNIEPDSPIHSDYSVYYRELNTKTSWVETPAGIVFDKTEVLLMDTSYSGYQFVDTARAYNINSIAKLRIEQLNSCRNALSIKNAGFIKLEKKQLLNKERYLVMCGDSSFIFVYKILSDSANSGFTCELYGSHSNDSVVSHYSFHKKDGEVFTFRKYK